MHKKKKDEDEGAVNKLPRSMDYFFLSAEDSNANKTPILVMIDENSGDRVKIDTPKQPVKSDGEMSIISLRESSPKKFHGVRITPPATAKGERQSTSAVEETRKTHERAGWRQNEHSFAS